MFTTSKLQFVVKIEFLPIENHQNCNFHIFIIGKIISWVFMGVICQICLELRFWHFWKEFFDLSYFTTFFHFLPQWTQKKCTTMSRTAGGRSSYWCYKEVLYVRLQGWSIPSIKQQPNHVEASCSHCGNLKIFPIDRFYVKSMLAIFES